MASIEFICGVSHSGEDTNRDGPTITLNGRAWAYCAHGGIEAHEWHPIVPMTLDELQTGQHRPENLSSV
jgi:hypothetical protein